MIKRRSSSTDDKQRNRRNIRLTATSGERQQSKEKTTLLRREGIKRSIRRADRPRIRWQNGGVKIPFSVTILSGCW